MILKDQPKKLGPKRVELLKLKFNFIQEFYDNWNSDYPFEYQSEEGRPNEAPERKYLIQNGFF